MIAEMINSSGWTHEQWLAGSILAFIVVATLVMLHRIYRLMNMARKKQYKPNLRPLRRRRFHED